MLEKYPPGLRPRDESRVTGSTRVSAIKVNHESGSDAPDLGDNLAKPCYMLGK